MKNRRGPRLPGRTLIGRGFWLAYCGSQDEEKEPHAFVGTIFIGLDYQNGTDDDDDFYSVITTACTISWRFNLMQFTSCN